MAERLRKRHLAQRFCSIIEQFVEWRKSSKHALHIVIAKIQARGLLQPFVPKLMPQHGNTDELMTDKVSLFYQSRTMNPHAVHDLCRGMRPSGHIGLHGNSQGVNQGLRMYLANLSQEPVYSGTDSRVWLVDSCNKLWDDLQPRVNAHRRKAFADRLINVAVPTVCKPERQ